MSTVGAGAAERASVCVGAVGLGRDIVPVIALFISNWDGADDVGFGSEIV